MNRLVALCLTLGMAVGIAPAKRDKDPDRDKDRQSCVLVVERPQGNVEIGCAEQ